MDGGGRVGVGGGGDGGLGGGQQGRTACDPNVTQRTFRVDDDVTELSCHSKFQQ